MFFFNFNRIELSDGCDDVEIHAENTMADIQAHTALFPLHAAVL